MGFSHDTYMVYGVHVPREQHVKRSPNEEAERLDDVIKSEPGLSGTGIGHLTAGDYDRDELFICANPPGWKTRVELGTFRVVQSHSFALSLLARDEQIRHLAAAAGYTDLGDPGWIIIPDCS